MTADVPVLAVRSPSKGESPAPHKQRLVWFVTFTFLSYGFFLIPYEVDTLLPGLRLPDVGFGVLVLYGAYSLARDKRLRLRLMRDRMCWISLGVIGLTVVEIVYTHRRYIGQPIKDTLALSANYLYYLLYVPFVILLRDQRWRHALTDVAAFAAASVALLFSVQVISGYQIFALSSREFEYAGKAVARNIAGVTPFTFFAIYYSWLRFRRGEVRHFTWWFGLPLMACMLSLTRGYIVVAILGLTLLSVARIQGRRMNPLMPVFLSITLIVSMVFGDVIFHRLASGAVEIRSGEGTGYFRWMLLVDRWNLMRRENSLLGVGFLHARTGIDLGLTRGYVFERAINVWTSDNSIATVVAQLGFAGIGLLGMFVSLLCGRAARVASAAIRDVTVRQTVGLAVVAAVGAALILSVESGVFVDRPWPLMLFSAWITTLAVEARGPRNSGLHSPAQGDGQLRYAP